MTTFLATLALIVSCLAFLLLIHSIRTHADPAPANPSEDPLSYVPSPLRKGPPGRSGAVALVEPEDDNPPDAFSRIVL